MDVVVVHSVPGSPFGRSVLATLEEKGAPWRLNALGPGESKAATHLARHPFGRVPAMEQDGFVLYETQAILRHLDRTLPDPPLTPADPRRAARMDQAMGINDWYLFPGCASVIVFQRVIGPALLGASPDEALIASALPRAETAFGALGDILGEEPWFGGQALSLADLLIGPQMELFARTPEWAGLTRARPNLAAWLARLEARPSFQATTWDRLRALATR